MISKEDVLSNLEQVKKYIQEAETQPADEKKKINITIKNRWTGAIIFESEKTTYREAIREAIDGDANLTHADFTDADLTDADLTCANLTRANLTGANLTGCLFYMGAGNKNFAALCKAIKTIKHQDGKFEDLI